MISLGRGSSTASLTHEGNLAEDGRHFPVAESGGARVNYDAEKAHGVGLAHADGWRVPYSGSDCVIYHEGVGHVDWTASSRAG